MYVDRCMLDVWKIGKTLYEYYSSGKCCNVVFCGVLKSIYQSFTSSRPTRDNGFLESVALLMFFFVFASQVLSVVVFFSSCVSMLYYLGFMQFLIRNLGRFLSFCLGTSPVESINAASNIFIGQVSRFSTFENLQIQFFWWWKPILRVQGFSSVCPFARIV